MTNWDDDKRFADATDFGQIRNSMINNIKTGYDESGTYKEIFVDAHNGSNTTGDGTIRKPFKTLGKAVLKSEAVEPYGVIHLASGTYNSNVEITKSTVISGSGVGTTHITGNITFSGGVCLLEKCYLMNNIFTINTMAWVIDCTSLGRVVINDAEIQCRNFTVSNELGNVLPTITISGANSFVDWRYSAIKGVSNISAIEHNGGILVLDACIVQTGATCTFPTLLSTSGIISLRDTTIIQQGLLVGGIAIDCSTNDATIDNENWITNSKICGSITCGAKHTCLHFVRIARVGGFPTGTITGTNKITAGDE